MKEEIPPKPGNLFIEFIRSNWITILISIIIGLAIYYYFIVKAPLNFAGNKSNQGPCYSSIPGRDSSSFIKLNITYKCAKIDEFDISSCFFDGIDYAHSCITYNDDRDSYIMAAFVKVDKKDSVFKISSQVSSSQKKEKYTFSIIAQNYKGDTIGVFKKEKTMPLPFTYDNINDTIKCKRNAKKSSTSNTIHPNMAKRS